MHKIATLDQWKELYDIAIEIKTLEPWKYLWDSDFITIVLPDKMFITCSIMGRGGECFATAAFFGPIALKNLTILTSNPDVPQEQTIRYQNDNVMLCYFGDRDELTKEEWNVTKALGYKFRGKNNWIYFRSYMKGYAPYMLEQEEVIRLTEVFKQLKIVLTEYIEQGIEVDFDEGETLVRMYSEEHNQWVYFAAPVIDFRYPDVIIEDETLMSRLKKMKMNNYSIEVDVVYIKAVVKDEEYYRPVLPRLCIIADLNGIILDQNMLGPENDEIQEVLDMTIDFILNNGKPKCIYVRDEYYQSMLKDLCKQTKIRLEVQSRLNAIDTLVDGFNNLNNW